MTQNDSQSILAELRGQSIVLPDLNAIFLGWPKDVNPGLDRLRDDVDEWLTRTLSHNSKIKSLRGADFGYFGATWWPQASYDRLKTCTLVAVWLFAWDDEIDEDDGSLWDDSELSQPYRDETREYVRACLSLRGKLDHENIGPTNATIIAFESIGMAIRDAYSYEQRLRFMDECNDFLEMSQREQVIRLRGVPTMEEFWSYRLGSSAVYVTLAVNEYAWDNGSLPCSVMDHDDMILLRKYTNIIISVTNDILSLKKEIARGSIGSMIPLEYAKSRNAQGAVDHTTELLIMAVKGFQQTEEKLLKGEMMQDEKQARQIREYIKGCQYNCTGNLVWSLATKRYGVHDENLAKGVCIQL